MRKITLLISANIFIGFLLSSCDKEITECPGLDGTLVGSISYIYTIDANGTINEVEIENFQKDYSRMQFIKLSESTASFSLDSRWGEESMNISVPEIEILGKPYDVYFDYVTQGKISYDDYNGVLADVSISGRMVQNAYTRCSPTMPVYACDINIAFQVNSNRIVLKITSAKPS